MGSPGGPLGSPGGSPGGLLGVPWGPWAVPGGPWGSLGGPSGPWGDLGIPWDPHADPSGVQRGALGKLKDTEQAIQARVAAIRQLGDAEGPGSRVVLDVAGTRFVTTIGAITRFPHSVIAELWQQHHARVADPNGTPDRNALEIDGDPSQFHLILSYLRRGRLPVVENVAQMQWLES